MLIYRTGASEEESFRHCLLIHDKYQFMRLVTLCTNARVLQHMSLNTNMAVV